MGVFWDCFKMSCLEAEILPFKDICTIVSCEPIQYIVMAQNMGAVGNIFNFAEIVM